MECLVLPIFLRKTSLGTHERLYWAFARTWLPASSSGNGLKEGESIKDQETWVEITKRSVLRLRYLQSEFITIFLFFYFTAGALENVLDAPTGSLFQTQSTTSLVCFSHSGDYLHFLYLVAKDVDISPEALWFISELLWPFWGEKSPPSNHIALITFRHNPWRWNSHRNIPFS